MFPIENEEKQILRCAQNDIAKLYPQFARKGNGLNIARENVCA
ncbi:MAG: hypothetical protein ACRD3D_17375 [Terriglobia bacterium]